MGDSTRCQPHDAARYRVRVLDGARPTGEGISYRSGEGPELLPWNRVRRAIGAEVGEPEGVRTVVFDLVVGLDEDGCEVYRFDADPYQDAMAVARAIEGALGAERAAPSIKSLASDGRPTRCFPDLESFAEAALDELES